ncbi:hypothetical protein BOTCAL_0431g00010 [Botryotinia calthae]|uniref:Core Histone H2A/H2B/H3 domain-containing protein n=1 Tax=Botryotinia calthae TaxID=38488 RepID=A0A4Y8CPM0_9HELO|nr:hypothetical protein BOTCAL_0431g00010 [Botryotinia calthae]
MPTRKQHLRELARIRREENVRRSRHMVDRGDAQGLQNGVTHTPDHPSPYSPRRFVNRTPTPPRSPTRSPTRFPTPSPSPRHQSNDPVYNQRAQIGGKPFKSSRVRKSVIGRKPKPKKGIKSAKISIFRYKPRRMLPSGKRVHDLKLLLREIKFYTNTWANLIPRSPSARLVRQVAHSIQYDLRFQSSAIEALQEAAEMMLAVRFDILQDMARHAHRTTIMGRDAGLLQRTLKKAVGIDDIGLASTSEGFRGYKT